MFLCRRATATKDSRFASSGPWAAGRERNAPAAVLTSAVSNSGASRSTASALPSGQHSTEIRNWRLHKHADYQRVYQASRKQFATLMTWFAAVQPAERGGSGPRIGITAGKVLGEAVERNRIKRRMRAAIVQSLHVLHADVDLVLHPRRAVLTADWSALEGEIRRIFRKVEEANARPVAGRTTPEQQP